ncbi:MAG: YraN family protein [Bacteroidales bacterium]
MEPTILGKKGETWACEYLQKAKYKIREVNYRAGRNEIDIIASQGRYIIFVEVKTRTYNTICDPEQAVNWKKQQAIIKTAHAYILKHQLSQMEARFDIIGIRYKNDKNMHILHIPNAYYPM